MYADDFPQSPKQVTVTQVWHTTRKPGRDDEEIEATRLKVAAERKAARKQKPFSRERSKSAPPTFQESESSELTQPEVILEARVDAISSGDDRFEKPLISPAAKKRLHSAMDITPPSKTKSRSKVNPESKMPKDLHKQVNLQMNVIADLRHKLSLIRDISNDTKSINKKEMNEEIEMIRKNVPSESKISVSKKDNISSTYITTDKASKNEVHIHIN